MSINPGRLKLELLCLGARIEPGCDPEGDTRPVKRTRGGLGSGLDAILPHGVWVNIPVKENFARKSPFSIRKKSGRYSLWSQGRLVCPIVLPQMPAWYENLTSSGLPMDRVAVMQGTYLAAYPSGPCRFWESSPPKNCRFCSVGLCLGETESAQKSVEDVVETARAARKHEGISFVHFNTGFAENDGGLESVFTYVEAVKRRTGLLVGVQCPPALDLAWYDRLKKAGADHISLCFEIFDPRQFPLVCPGKAETFGRLAGQADDSFLRRGRDLAVKHLKGLSPHPGQLMFYRAILYCRKLWGKGPVAGEIIAGLEPVEMSLAAVDFLAECGAVATVCVFRPSTGTMLENAPSPDPGLIAPVFARQYEVCVENGLPIGIAPNIRTAMVHTQEEGRWLSEGRVWWRESAFRAKNSLLSLGFRAFFKMKMAFHGLVALIIFLNEDS